MSKEKQMQSTQPNCCAGEEGFRTTERDQKLKANLLSRLKRAEGQVRGVYGMIERDAYCDDVIHQLSAVSSALDSVSKLVLEYHIRRCLVDKIRAGQDEIVNELLVTIGKLL